MSFFKRLFSGDDDYEEDEAREPEEKTASVPSVSAPAPSKKDPHKPEFLLIKPTSRDELGDIAKNLMDGKTVVLNLELITKDNKRFVDFLSGVSFALEGQIKKIASSTYLIIPGNVNISGDIFDDFEEDNY